MSRLLFIGRIVFAIAIVGFGVLCLVYVDSVHQLQPINELMSDETLVYDALAILTGVFLVAAGLAIGANVKASSLAAALTAYFLLWIVLLQIPSAFIDPSLLLSPWWVRTFETLALTGGALVLAGLTRRPEREQWLRAGRILFGISLPVFGVLHLIYADNVASLIPSWYPWPLFLAYLTGLANIAAGIAIVSGTLSRLAAILAGVMYGLYALTLHIPSQFEYADPRGEQTSLFVAIGMWGTAWIVTGSLAKRERTSNDEHHPPTEQSNA